VTDTRRDVGQAVLRSIDFLRGADRTREGVKRTRAAFEALRRRLAPLQVELVVDSPPGHRTVDYDVLISNAERETTMLGWHRDEGRPWSIDYSEHWAANFVVTVNKRHVSIQEALAFLREAEGRHPGLARRLVDETLLASAVEQDPPKVTEREIRRAGEIFRIVHGLSSASALRRWLDGRGTTMAAWEEWLAGGVRNAKWTDRLCKGRIEPYFLNHHADLAILLVQRASMPDREAARQLLHAARSHSLHEAVGDSQWRGVDVESGIDLMRLDELPRQAQPDAVAGARLGPFAIHARHVVFQVVKRRPAKLNLATRALIRERLVADWLSAERVKASLQWHW
jgi:putative peptide maturation system protein